MSPSPSILGRLSRKLLAGWIVWNIAILGSLWWVVSHEIAEILDDEMVESAQIFSGLLAYDIERLRRASDEARVQPSSRHEERLIWQIVNGRNEILMRSHRAPEQALAPAGATGFGNFGLAWRTYSLPLADTDWMLHVGQATTERNEAVSGVIKYTVGTAIAIGILILLWLRFSVRREFRPLELFSRAVRDYDPIAQPDSLPPVKREELEPMRSAIQSLASRLAHRIANEQAFSAHAAHALRTPLAGLDAQLAIALREAPPAGQARIAKARQAADRLQRVVKALLVLFRSGSEPQWQHFRLSEVMTSLSFTGVTVDLLQDDILEADPDLIIAALANLVDNSVRHHATRITIEVTQAEPCRIVMRDDGSGILPERLVELQQALAEQAYARLSGLGLMLADMVARAHGGRLSMTGDDTGCTSILEIARPDRDATSVSR